MKQSICWKSFKNEKVTNKHLQWTDQRSGVRYHRLDISTTYIYLALVFNSFGFLYNAILFYFPNYLYRSLLKMHWRRFLQSMIQFYVELHSRIPQTTIISEMIIFFFNILWSAKVRRSIKAILRMIFFF